MSIFKSGSALKNIESLAGHFGSILEQYTEEFLANGNIESGIFSYLISIIQAHQANLVKSQSLPIPPVVPNEDALAQ